MTEPRRWQHPYPIMASLTGSRCLVIGGGQVAERKVRSLLNAGAHVTVIAAEFSEGLAGLSGVVLRRETFNVQTLDEAGVYLLLVAATNDKEVNARIARYAMERSMLINVVDQPELSTFIMPSVVRRGKLVIAVSTAGASPSAARRIVKEIDAAYGEEYEMYLDFLSRVRLLVQERVTNKEARQKLFKEMLDWDLLGMIRQGDFGGWSEVFYQALEQQPWMSGQGEAKEAPSWAFLAAIGWHA
ncbi:precorrin-2 dehydrogenase/sirohydrochlorin ferrochelatase family protein [Paenibacillus whitsoniae]|uniref:precorrin-2 dehydrogenase/sirohydrochlorin ferrochelatase family protein n=1 Tax=Paenibacillus whitsoniae TaxID=2496558 RepID=UPI0013E0A407|nr:bifunctional precorrin-2 dehydrogenase/sirohydrochlorin ferrochelatase [Paenibacillus whitsoniae]